MRKFYAWPVALVAAVTTGLTAPAAAPASAAAPPATATVERDRQLRERVTELLPADYRARLAAVADQPDVVDLRRLVERVINPDDYVCGSTELFDWLSASVA